MKPNCCIRLHMIASGYTFTHKLCAQLFKTLASYVVLLMNKIERKKNEHKFMKFRMVLNKSHLSSFSLSLTLSSLFFHLLI